ncbi:MAG: peptidylprolyl isomerase [Clostridia bacterium]|nr:peptidylprolyl isomerase [Clostridia bacterium]
MYDAYDAYVHGKARTVKAAINFENGDTIKLELYPDIAPETVENFVKLADSGFYNGLTFHRVIKDFMIQGGGYDADGTMKNSSAISGQFISNGYLNLITHERGVISMARTMQSKDSASSQFFIMHQTIPSLDGDYAAFGKVTDGMDVVDKIASSATDSGDKPLEDVIIKSITTE